MPTEIINSERQFQIWKYTVSHSQLLLRSTKSSEFSTRIDVFFKGVKEFHLPTSFTGLSIAEASDADIQKLCSLRKSLSFGKDVKVFKVQGIDFLGYVIALIVVSHEDEGEYDDPSFFAENNIL
jgi:hypothetical protein